MLIIVTPKNRLTENQNITFNLTSQNNEHVSFP